MAGRSRARPSGDRSPSSVRRGSALMPIVSVRTLASSRSTLLTTGRQRAAAQERRDGGMQRVSTYLNFMGNTEEAFAFYASVFGTEPEGPMMRMADMPPPPGSPPLSEGRAADDHAHRAPDPGRPRPDGDRHARVHGTRSCEPGTTSPSTSSWMTGRRPSGLLGLLSEGGSDLFGLQDMPWGAYWGTCADRFGVRWMFNCAEPPPSSTVVDEVSEDGGTEVARPRTHLPASRRRRCGLAAGQVDPPGRRYDRIGLGEVVGLLARSPVPLALRQVGPRDGHPSARPLQPPRDLRDQRGDVVRRPALPGRHPRRIARRVRRSGRSWPDPRAPCCSR